MKVHLLPKMLVPNILSIHIRSLVAIFLYYKSSFWHLRNMILKSNNCVRGMLRILLKSYTSCKNKAKTVNFVIPFINCFMS